MGESAVRASYLRRLLDRADTCGSADQSGSLGTPGVRERVGDAEVTAIECAGPLVWLPISLDLVLQQAVVDVFGSAGARELLSSSLRQVWAGTRTRTIIQAAVAMLGVNPGSLARVVPNAWNLLYRDCGRWLVERPEGDWSEANRQGGQRVILRLVDLPIECAEQQAWLDTVATILHGLLVLCDTEGEVEQLGQEARSGTNPRSSATFRLQWRT